MRGYDFEIERAESVEHMRARLGDVGPTFVTRVRGVSQEGRLDETFVDTLCEPAEVFTYGGMIAHVLTFAAHRRTLVAGALQAAGITDRVPATRCAGWPSPPDHRPSARHPSSAIWRPAGEAAP